ncbi:TetR/AcrR family transcriptional regulator [Mycolicibacterium pyrenivorans]|uniref:TetR/AcrR family transcriptional regulator n=1 Tax=Mycolicibacterium pyrenivorans TaxID=187102 RepID=UPI0021F35F2B|nr:TetR/AcrR family transcriptional regulator [Mycolicibacterium pyrenivorans]MCV7154138.1 TetR/AcrR family transcriptional regulator [Mycolicibacterium pyrenivorans]
MPSPSRGLRQPERVEISSRKLARAAAELIIEKGWEATTAAEIGRRAGYSRAMVHARYGSKDAVLDAIFMREYMAQLSPDLDPEADGLHHALAHLDRIGQLAADDPELLRAMFVAAFEAVKSTSALRPRSLGQLEVGLEKVRAGLEKGIADGSVRPDVDVAAAVTDISSAVYGIAYLWLVLPGGNDLEVELRCLRARLIRDYGHPPG